MPLVECLKLPTCHHDTKVLVRFLVVTPKMCLGSEMGPNKGATINKIGCAETEQHFPHVLFKYAYRCYRP
ncbi:hypothetical protein E2C01_069800 [Portunus trituberculatus]|uniref:Uncharacterized protein n=1 Tax=Portunus trituberculatus TaxID=210409 RepID=A0A5B7HZI8_PORTR|nr:hypothetical protein [Portunus trituberculatus]